MVELLIFSAIFSLVTISFLSILVAVVRVQARQGASNEVNQQTDFALATIQRAVERSSHIEGDAGQAATEVTLRMPVESEDPVRIYAESGRIFLQQAGEDAEPLTTEGVSVTGASFLKQGNPGGKDSLAVSFTVSNVTGGNRARTFSRALSILVSRAAAATFDSDLIPAVGNTLKLGVNAQPWQSLNELLYFSGSNVGVGATSPNQRLEVDGGLRLNAGSGRPSCTSSIRGTVWVTQNGGSSADTIDACLKNASSTYGWVAL